MRFFFGSALLSGATFLYSFAVLAQCNSSQLPLANPGRPTVSTPATLTPVGYLQFENGGLYANESPEFSNRLAINQVTKLAITSRIQLLALSEPFTHSTGAEVSGNRSGEVFVGLQTVLIKGEGYHPTVSVSYIRRLYESLAPEIDIGTFRQSAFVLVSNDIGGFHFDLNGIVTEQAEDRVRRAQFGETLSISHSIGPFTLSGELWHFSQPLTNANAVGNLWALSYPMKRNLVFDAGFNHGLTSTSTHWEGFAGFTYVLPRRLWKAREQLRATKGF
ncbi:hypothetical protein [Edaphobacter flagellatus]|uniref:hypothetical protein n=1 Tax=Edaphobacter flagellatus TaxID=1933044 RepID=UPI0021B2DBE9|nr:hypothetical protein [Edaphobacter flagellatus]